MASKRTKPALTLDQHKALGAELHAMSERLSVVATDLGERYAARVSDKLLRAGAGVDDARAALDTVLWHEQRGTADRATLDVVYYPGQRAAVREAVAGTLGAVPVADPATKRGPAEPVAPAVPKVP